MADPTDPDHDRDGGTAPDDSTGDEVASDDDADDPNADGPDDADAEIPARLRENLYVVVEELADHDGLLVALDFDGTLAAIENRPEEATIPDPTREAVASLAHEPNVEVAVVSGRELADVRERVGVPDISYAGNHGLEIHADEYTVHPTASAAEEDIAELCDLLTDELAHVEGVIVENKGVTATVHHRLVDDDEVPAVVDAVETLVAARDDVRLTTGKDVLELRPAVEWDKGEAVRELREELVPDDERWLPVYVGDDTTDEAAFLHVGDRGLGVKVGDDPDTEAPYRVADSEAVRTILEWLHEYGVEFVGTDHRDVSGGPS
ncbi:trehalose-phosphatase [Halorussus sp. MSC15.2]|uniref:trehalose-phosphatase n=1 Tax=Halorussus sp. MSC15.2 TaxID=2283638 RepID=UPI0013D546CB|nr:trehalose-phosphatase [Halorussus sp. MSC15.2]NEU58955.1 trehalose-phosphatase [Halorussus sp. MSC15.2]